MHLDELVADIQRDFPDPIDTSVLRAVRRALQDFCKRSEAWRHQFTEYFIEGETAYPFEVPDGTYALAVTFVRASFDDGTQRNLQSVTAHDFVMRPDGSPVAFAVFDDELLLSHGGGKGELTYEVKLAPKRTITEIPDEFADRYAETIRNGALYQLLRVPGQVWSSQFTRTQVEQYRFEFDEGILEARREARKDRDRPARVAKANGDYQIGRSRSRGLFR